MANSLQAGSVRECKEAPSDPKLTTESLNWPKIRGMRMLKAAAQTAAITANNRRKDSSFSSNKNNLRIRYQLMPSIAIKTPQQTKPTYFQPNVAFLAVLSSHLFFRFALDRLSFDRNRIVLELKLNTSAPDMPAPTSNTLPENCRKERLTLFGGKLERRLKLRDALRKRPATSVDGIWATGQLAAKDRQDTLAYRNSM